MLSIAHGLTGALIVTKIPNPALALPLAVAVHYLLDFVPHWDFGQGLRSGQKSKVISFFQELLVDLPLSVFITYLLFQVDKPFNIYLWLGWLAGLLPDFIEFPKLFLKQKNLLLEAHSAFHKRFHISIPDKFWGLLPQVIVLMLVFALS